MANIDNHYNQKQVYGISRARLAKILSLLDKDLSGKKILDIGCGNGELGSVLKEMGAIVHGCDLSHNAVSQAGDKLNKAFVFDVEKDDFAILDKDYDVVIASEVIEHLFKPKDFLLNLKNIIKSGGSIILTTPNFLVWTNRIKMLLGRFEYTNSGLMDEGHIHFFSRDSLLKCLSDCGFAVEVENNVNYSKMAWIGKIWPNLGSYQVVIKAKIK